MKGISTIAAERMGQVADYDPQFQLPVLPRFAKGLQCVPMVDGLLIHGSESLQVLRGRSATIFLPRLIPLLDGSRTVEEISKEFPQHSPQDIKNALALLYARGLLEDGKGDEGVDLGQFPSEILEFYRRHTDTTRVNRSAGEGLHRLKQSKIAVWSNMTQASEIVNELIHSGIGDAWMNSWEEPPDLTEATFLLVCVTGRIDHGKLLELDDVCAKQGIPWMFSYANGQKGILGPYFERNETPCYSCFRSTFPMAKEGEEPPEESLDFWVHYTVLELFYMLTRQAPSITGMDLVTFNFDDWSVEKRRAIRRPGCNVCLPIMGLNQPVDPEPAYQFDSEIAFPSRKMLDPKSHQHHYKISNHDLTFEAKEYPSAPSFPLVNVEDLPLCKGDFLSSQLGNQHVEPSSLTKASLSRMVLSGVGLRGASDGSKNQRWAPTGGNLGSPQLYVWVRSVEGMSPNLYFYQVNDHSVIRVGPPRRSSEIAEIMEQTTGLSGAKLPDALIVLTGAYGRVASKYLAFAYRVIHLDAGVAVAQMQAVAKGLGLSFVTLPHWNEKKLFGHLEIDKEREPITAVCALSGGRRQA